MRNLMALVFAAMLGVAFVGSTFAADTAAPPAPSAAKPADNGNKTAGAKAEKKHAKHQKKAMHKKEDKKM